MRGRAVAAAAALQIRVAADRDALADPADYPEGAAATDDLSDALRRLADALATTSQHDPAE